MLPSDTIDHGSDRAVRLDLGPFMVGAASTPPTSNDAFAEMPGFRGSWSHVRVNLGVELRECVRGRSGSCAYAAAAVREVGQVGSKADTRGGGSMESAW
jgi:hypothetical protein